MNDEVFVDSDGLPNIPVEAPLQSQPDAAEGDAIAWMADSETHLPEIEHRAHVHAYGIESAPLPVCDIDAADGEACEEPATARVWSGAAVVTSAALGSLVGALLVAATLVWLFGLWPGSRPFNDVPSTVATSGDVTINASTDVDAAVAVAAKVNPTVVNVSIEQRGFDRFTGATGLYESGNGSGVIIGSDGYILTNNHVIDGADRIVVTIGPDDLEATVVGTDPQTDLAVLKVPGVDYPMIEVGSSAELKVGQFVVAVGSPFGLEKTVTSGIISALQRSNVAESNLGTTAYTNLIQTDAAINPGNSGGALVDGQGRLIGINTLIQSTSGASAGIGFAIPVDYAIDVAEQIIATGSAVHPYMGVSTATIDEVTAQRFDMRVTKGALVQFVEPNSPAAAGGLERGDIIVKIDGRAIEGTEDVFGAVRARKVGDRVAVVVVRGDAERTFQLTLASDSVRN